MLKKWRDAAKPEICREVTWREEESDAAKPWCVLIDILSDIIIRYYSCIMSMTENHDDRMKTEENGSNVLVSETNDNDWNRLILWRKKQWQKISEETQ